MDMEREYNNRAAVPDHMEVMSRWRSEASAYRAAHPNVKQYNYGSGERHLIDIFYAKEGGKSPSIALFIHGGYWQALDGTGFSHIARGLNLRGLDVAIITYDLCPSIRLADVQACTRAATHFLWREFQRLIVPFGHSAGGHLTATLLATDWKTVGPNIPANLASKGLAISGLFDLVPLVGTSINDKLGMDENEAIAVSPLFQAPRSSCNLVSTVGELESSEYHRQTRLITDVWKAHGAKTRQMVEPGKNHFTVLDDLSDPASRMTDTLVQLCGDA